MNTEDDFISRLMDETYNGVEHPTNELSNQNVKSLADYFSKREEKLDVADVTFSEFKSFYRLKHGDKCLDIPKGLGWVDKSNHNNKRVYMVMDVTLVEVLTELEGEEVNQIEVDSSGEVSFSYGQSISGNMPKAA